MYHTLIFYVKCSLQYKRSQWPCATSVEKANRILYLYFVLYIVCIGHFWHLYYHPWCLVRKEWVSERASEGVRSRRLKENNGCHLIWVAEKEHFTQGARAVSVHRGCRCGCWMGLVEGKRFGRSTRTCASKPPLDGALPHLSKQFATPPRAESFGPLKLRVFIPPLKSAWI